MLDCFSNALFFGTTALYFGSKRERERLTDRYKRTNSAGSLCRQVHRFQQVSEAGQWGGSDWQVAFHLRLSGCVVFCVLGEQKQGCKDQAHFDNKPSKTNPVAANISEQHSVTKKKKEKKLKCLLTKVAVLLWTLQV